MRYCHLRASFSFPHSFARRDCDHSDSRILTQMLSVAILDPQVLVPQAARALRGSTMLADLVMLAGKMALQCKML